MSLPRLSSRLRAGLRRAARSAGFTILEILIAIVVLALGITGIIALFPTAIESGNQTVEDSYAAAITQSVVDAVTVGLRESRYSTDVGSATWSYFIFNHDGVVDAPPSRPAEYDGNQDAPKYSSPELSPNPQKMWNNDYCVLLPQAVDAGGNVIDGNTTIEDEPIFVFPAPVTPTAEESQRRPPELEGGVVDNMATDRFREATDGELVRWFPRVYRLGVYRDPGASSSLTLPSGMQPGEVRQEFRGDQLQVGSTPTDTIAVDPYPTYSFAFTLQRARVDTNDDGNLGAADQFSSSLYQLTVYVFKNFDQAAADDLAPASPPGNMEPSGSIAVPETNRPIKTFVTLISI